MDKESSPDMQSKIALSLEKARALLYSKPGGFSSTTTTAVQISDNFFPYLVLEVTGDE